MSDLSIYLCPVLFYACFNGYRRVFEETARFYLGSNHMDEKITEGLRHEIISIILAMSDEKAAELLKALSELSD